jgi:hypothetical protein
MRRNRYVRVDTRIAWEMLADRRPGFRALRKQLRRNQEVADQIIGDALIKDALADGPEEQE